MKIIQVDNFGRDYISDTLIAENVLETLADEIAECLNDEYSGSTSPIHFIVKPDDYKLKEFNS